MIGTENTDKAYATLCALKGQVFRSGSRLRGGMSRWNEEQLLLADQLRALQKEQSGLASARDVKNAESQLRKIEKLRGVKRRAEMELAYAGERRAGYKSQSPFAGSRRYYRGRIVQALRELPANASLSQAELRRNLDIPPSKLTELLVALHRDGLVRQRADGSVRLP